MQTSGRASHDPHGHGFPPPNNIRPILRVSPRICGVSRYEAKPLGLRPETRDPSGHADAPPPRRCPGGPFTPRGGTATARVAPRKVRTSTRPGWSKCRLIVAGRFFCDPSGRACTFPSFAGPGAFSTFAGVEKCRYGSARPRRMDFCLSAANRTVTAIQPRSRKNPYRRGGGKFGDCEGDRPSSRRSRTHPPHIRRPARRRPA
jgi:hypothetical protein